MTLFRTIHGSAHDIPLPDGSVQTIVTSPPYWGLRKYSGDQGVEWPAVTYAPMPGLPPVTVVGCDPDCAHEWGDASWRDSRLNDDKAGPKQRSNGGATGWRNETREQSICAKCGGWRGDLGLEPDPLAYVGHLILCLREWRRILRDDGIIMINLGDSYFGGGAQRAGAYGTSGKEPEGCLGHGCSSENPCDACQRRERRTSRKGSQTAPTQVVSPSAPSHVHTASERAHLPTSDSSHLAGRNVPAMQGQGNSVDLAGEQLRASLESMPDESSLPHPADSHQSATFSSFPSAAGSLPASIRESARRTASRSEPQTFDAAIQDQHSDTQCSAATGDASDDHISGTASDSFSYPYFNTTPRHGQAGLKPKDLCGIPWRLAFAAQADGWWLRSDIIWAKPNPMPESVTDRPTKAHEYIFMLAKSQRYYWDADAVKEASTESTIERGKYGWNGSVVIDDDGRERRAQPDPTDKMGERWSPARRNLRSVWSIATAPFPGSHFATFPPKLVEPCIRAGSSERGACPHCGAPWRRVTEKGLTAHDGDTNSQYANGTTANRLALLRQAARERGGEYTNGKQTIGWQPTCSCPAADPVPCVVMDPFSGSGTTGVVALKLGRAYVGVDISQEYLDGVTAERIGGGVQIGLGV